MDTTTLQYRETKRGDLAVLLEGRRVGTIERMGTGWTYFPKGSRTSEHGSVFPTLHECQRSLES